MRLRSAVLLKASLGGSGICMVKPFQTASTYNATENVTLCFSEAFREKGEHRISEQEYVGHLTAHLHGIRH